MYNTKLVEVLDGFWITCLIPLTVFTFLLNTIAIVAVVKLRKDSHISVLGNLVFCDLLLVLCQSFSLKSLITGRSVTMEVDIMCNLCGVVFNTILSVTWWCLTFAFFIKMWHVPMTRLRYHVTILCIWSIGILLALVPYISEKVYTLSWTHAMCLIDDLYFLSLPKLSVGYSIVFSVLIFVQYLLPIILCVASIIKDVYSGRERIRSGWSCTVMVFFVYMLFYVMWWIDLLNRHYTPTRYPVSTSTIVRRTITLMILYMKPLACLFCMYHFMAEFKSMFLRVIGLRYETKVESGHHYERMYSEIDDRFSPGTTL